MILDMPYFMTNENWFEFDFKKQIFVLTKDAPDEAKESYKEYMKVLKEQV